jgi:hypothetical protein
MRKSRQLQRGNVFVETSLILLPFLALVLGIIDVARIMFIHNALNERIRQVARGASINNYSVEEIKNLIAFDTRTVPDGTDFTTKVGYQGIRVGNISVQYLDSGTNDRRVNILVSGMRLQTMSPFLYVLGSNIPIDATVPLETP